MLESELDAWIDTGAKLYGVAIRPEWNEAIRAHLVMSLEHMTKVLGANISDHTDLAPTYTP